MRLRTCAVWAVAIAMGTACHASTFFDQTVRVTHDAFDIGTVISGPFDSVVTAGIEVPSVLGFYSVDVSDANILLNFTQIGTGGTFSGGTFNGFHLFDLNGTIPTLLSVTILSTNVSGLDASRISFDANNVFVNFQGLFVDLASRVSLDVTAVPEPATLGLMGIALAVIGFRRRKLGPRPS